MYVVKHHEDYYAQGLPVRWSERQCDAVRFPAKPSDDVVGVINSLGGRFVKLRPRRRAETSEDRFTD